MSLLPDTGVGCKHKAKKKPDLPEHDRYGIASRHCNPHRPGPGHGHASYRHDRSLAPCRVPIRGRQGVVEPDADRDSVRAVGHLAAQGLVVSIPEVVDARGAWRLRLDRSVGDVLLGKSDTKPLVYL